MFIVVAEDRPVRDVQTLVDRDYLFKHPGNKGAAFGWNEDETIKKTIPTPLKNEMAKYLFGVMEGGIAHAHTHAHEHYTCLSRGR